jgi:hypothetical protein
MIALQESYEAEGLPIQSLAINEILRGGTYLELVSTNHDVPVLQDTAEVGAWGLWGVQERDLVVLDERNQVIAQFNLYSESLLDPQFQSEFDSLVREAAESLSSE